jgi:hypothetical protein
MRNVTATENGGDAYDLGVDWQKSSYSMSNGQCVEVARLADGRIGLLDSKDPDGPVLRFEPAEFATFLTELRDSKS